MSDGKSRTAAAPLTAALPLLTLFQSAGNADERGAFTLGRITVKRPALPGKPATGASN